MLSLNKISDEVKAQRKIVLDALQTLKTRSKSQEDSKNVAAIEQEEHSVNAYKQKQKDAIIDKQNRFVDANKGKQRWALQIEKQKLKWRRTSSWDGNFCNANFCNIDEDFVIENMISDHTSCVAMCGSSILMIYDDGAFSQNGNIPRELNEKLDFRAEYLPSPEYAALGPDDAYFIRFGVEGSEWSVDDVGLDLLLEKHRSEIDKVQFSADGGWFVLLRDRSTFFSKAFGGLEQILTQSSLQGRLIEDISLGSCGSYFVSFADGCCIFGPSKDHEFYCLNNLVDRVNLLKADGCRIYQVYFGATADEWLIRYRKISS